MGITSIISLFTIAISAGSRDRLASSGNAVTEALCSVATMALCSVEYVNSKIVE